MRNQTKEFPFSRHTLSPLKSVTWKSSAGLLLTYSPDTEPCDFEKEFPYHSRVVAMLDASSAEWPESTFMVFRDGRDFRGYYAQFGQSLEGALEAYINNDDSLVVHAPADNVAYGFNAWGQPVDTARVKGFEVTLECITFKSVNQEASNVGA